MTTLAAASAALLLLLGSECSPTDPVQVVLAPDGCQGGVLEIGLLETDGNVTPLGEPGIACFEFERDLAERIHARCVWADAVSTWVQAEYGVGTCGG